MTEITEAVERLKDLIQSLNGGDRLRWSSEIASRETDFNTKQFLADAEALLSELTRLQEEVKGLRAKADDLERIKAFASTLGD